MQVIRQTPVSQATSEWGVPDPTTRQVGAFGAPPPVPAPAPAVVAPAATGANNVMLTGDGVPFVLPAGVPTPPQAVRQPAPPEPTAPAVFVPQPALAGLARHPFVPCEVAQADSRFVDVSGLLPSMLGFYTWDSISVRPFGLDQVRMMNRAVAESSVIHQLNAISSVLTRSAYDLTLGDLQYLMYWLRLNSYRKNPVIVKWTCSNPAHLAAVGRKEQTPQSLQQTTKVASLDGVSVRQLRFKEVNEFMVDFYRQHGLYLFVPCAADLVEGMAEGLTPDDDWWNKYASLLNPQRHGLSLADRRTTLQGLVDASPDILSDMETFADLQEHGPVENVTGFCSVCQASTASPMRIDPMNFLPQARAVSE